MSGEEKDLRIIRRLAQQVAEIGHSPRQQALRKMWKGHNSLQGGEVPIHVWLSMCPNEIVPDAELECESEAWRGCERTLRLSIFQDKIADDTVVEPFFVLRARHTPDLDHRYGFPLITGRELDTAKFHFEPAVAELEDLDKLVMPKHRIDREATRAEAEKLSEAFGKDLPVVVDPAPMFLAIEGDISTDLGFLLGFENILYYLYDKPELLHRLAGLLAKTIGEMYEDAAKAGDWRSVSGANQCIPYSMELPDPSASDAPAPQSSLWGFMASQEFTAVSPAMFEEFLLPYQLPLLEKFGLSAYGCCEDLTHKIGMLKRIKNLRRISVTPWADVEACAEVIGRNYVLSWRPNPSTMQASLDEENLRKLVGSACGAFKKNGSVADITLKDVKTVFHRPQNLARWVEIVRSVCAKQMS